MKDSNSPVPQLGSVRRGPDRSPQQFQNNRYSGNIPSPSPGPFDYYMESEEHSMISDDGASEFSRNDTNEEYIRESVTNPGALIGWQINIKGRGVGLILDMKKSLGRTTKYKVQFENGTVKLLSLKRSEKKGNVPFSLITKAN